MLSAASKVNLTLALLLYEAAGAQGALLPNAKQFNPYNVPLSLSHPHYNIMALTNHLYSWQ